MCVCVCVYVCVFQGQRKGKPAYMLLECLLKLPRVFLCSPRQCTKQVFEMKQCLHPAHCKPSQINHQNPSVQILCCKGWSRSSSREELEFSKKQVLWPNQGRRPEEEEGRAETSKQSRDSKTQWRPHHAPAHREGHILSPLKSRQWFSVTRSPVDTRAPET